MSRAERFAQPDGMDPVGDAVVAVTYYGGRWVWERVRDVLLRRQPSADPLKLPMTEAAPEGTSGHVRVVSDKAPEQP